MLGLDVQPVYIVQHPIVGFGNHRHGPEMVVVPCVAVLPDDPLRAGLMRSADSMGVGQQYRTDKIAAVVNPVGTRHFSIAIKGMMPSPYRAGRRLKAGGQGGSDERLACAHASLTRGM